jgi:hypothetical protein
MQVAAVVVLMEEPAVLVAVRLQPQTKVAAAMAVTELELRVGQELPIPAAAAVVAHTQLMAATVVKALWLFDILTLFLRQH